MDRIERIRQSFHPPKLEKSDTHDYIQRHDPDFQKNKHRKKDAWKDHEEDMTDISVDSLMIFLEGLKREKTPRNLDKTNDDPTDARMKKAINAYTHEEEQAKKHYTYLEEGNAEDLDPEVIDSLIANLKHLLEKGIDHITLTPAKTFLGSIEKTVEKYNKL